MSSNLSVRHQQILNSLSQNIRQIISKLSIELLMNIEEIRLRKNKPLMVLIKGEDNFISREGKVVKDFKSSYMITDEDVETSLQLLCQSSIYAFSEEIKNGYITIPGGHRVGITGKVISSMGRVKTIKYVSGLNYRLSKEIRGAADKVMPYIVSPPNKVYHTLIISPPGCGKTTLIRDIARQLSDGSPSLGLKGSNITIVDERSEIAGCYRGVAQNDVGIRTDTLDGCPKAEGMIMAIRSMAPDVIITDEIGKKEDIQAISEALNAGVSVVTTAHGNNYSEVILKPILSEALSKNFFQRIIVLSARNGPGTIEAIYNGNGQDRLA